MKFDPTIIDEMNDEEIDNLILYAENVKATRKEEKIEQAVTIFENALQDLINLGVRVSYYEPDTYIHSVETTYFDYSY